MSERRIRNNKMKRQRQLKKNILLTLMTLCIVVTLAITFGSILSKANDGQEQYKYFTSIEVKRGDSLYAFAKAYMDTHYESEEHYIDEVMNINHLKDTDIKAGQFIIVPYYSDEFRTQQK